MDTLTRVRCLEEELVSLLVTPCPACAGGPLLRVGVRVSAGESGWLDEVSVRCRRCCTESVLKFQLDAQAQGSDLCGGFAASASPSAALDVWQWAQAADLLCEAATQETDGQSARSLRLHAARCLEEALKFLEPGEQEPPASAAWTPGGRQALAQGAADLTRRRLLGRLGELPRPTLGAPLNADRLAALTAAPEDSPS